ncbi:uncharacterized protein HGUI_00516 [Hanseniaspora guilliermondii]|uniref:GTP-binding protein YPT11 n=1 Tax=Hanseniaspora guilliermondii TaxID=56406 RepID=A0A1L0AXM3_9ASCO|nr:uncharacterized protein HGUI_00516 [Hanseniaspora guilliermondii]
MEDLNDRDKRKLLRQRKAQSLLIDTVTEEPSQAYKLDYNEAIQENKLIIPKRQLSQNRNSLLNVSTQYKQRSRSKNLEVSTDETIKKRVITPEMERNADNIKLLLLGDSNVGKTAIILRYCNELKTTTKEEHLMKTENKLFGKENDQPNHIKSLKLRKEKAYSLSDYENLINSPLNNDMNDLEINTGSTIGIDIKTQMINLDNRFFKIIMWDTAGQERFRKSLNPLMYKKTHGLILVYDISNLKSFESLWDYWLLEWLNNSTKKSKIYLIGNKTDLYKKREVTHEHVLKLMFKLESQYGNVISIGGNYEVSCKIQGKTSSGVEVAFERIIQDLVSRGFYDKNDEDDDVEVVDIRKKDDDNGCC